MVTCRNGVFFGSLYIYMGAVMAKTSAYPAMKKAVMGFIIFVLALWAEVIFVHSYGLVREEDMYLLQIPVTYFLLSIAIQLQTLRDTGWLRRMSMNIYFVHMIFKFAYRQLPGRENENGMLLFLVTFVGAWVTAFVMERRKKSLF